MKKNKGKPVQNVAILYMVLHDSRSDMGGMSSAESSCRYL